MIRLSRQIVSYYSSIDESARSIAIDGMNNDLSKNHHKYRGDQYNGLRIMGMCTP